MKKCCKHIDITDAKTNLPFVSDCIDRHFTRNDFARMLFSFGMDKRNIMILKEAGMLTLLMHINVLLRKRKPLLMQRSMLLLKTMKLLS